MWLSILTAMKAVNVFLQSGTNNIVDNTIFSVATCALHVHKCTVLRDKAIVRTTFYWDITKLCNTPTW